MMEDVLKGMAAGFAIAAPVGPIGILCIRRSMFFGPKVGFFSGLGAACADALFGAIAAFGVASVIQLLMRYDVPIRIVGGVVFCGIGLKTVITPVTRTEDSTSEDLDLWKAYFSTLLLTLSNPMAILSFLAVFAGMGNMENLDRGRATVLVVGVFLGAMVWWMFLTQVCGRFAVRITSGWLTWINRVAGALLVIFGIAVIVFAIIRHHSAA